MNIFNLLRRKRKAPPADDLGRYIDLDIDHPNSAHSLQCRSGAVVSLIAMDGLKTVPSQEEYAQAWEMFHAYLTRVFSNNETAISWMSEQTCDASEQEIERATAGPRKTARSLGIDLDEMLESTYEANKSKLVLEEGLLAIWTLPTANDYASYRQNEIQSERHTKMFGDVANPFRVPDMVLQKHEEKVADLSEKLKVLGFAHRVLGKRKAATTLKLKLNENMLPLNTPINLLDDGIPQGGNGLRILPDGSLDTSSLYTPPLSQQLVVNCAIKDPVDPGYIQSNGRWYAAMELTQFPRSKVHFNRLRRNLRGVNFRITFVMTPVQHTLMDRFNVMMSNYLRADGDNKDKYQNLEYQKMMKADHGIAQINLQMLVVINAKSKELLKNHHRKVVAAMADWSNSEVKYDSIDPIETYVTSIPGLNYRSLSRGVWISADRLANILPHQTVATRIWEQGVMLMRYENQPFWFHPSDLNVQDYDVSLFLAKPRQGKSLTMNLKDLAQLFSEGMKTLNLSCNIDIGPSSKGKMQLLRLLLAKIHGNKVAKQWVVDQDWDPNGGDSWSKNPLDIRFGASKPTEQEMTFYVSFYSAVTAEIETGQCKEGTGGLLREVITSLFEKINHQTTSNKWDPTLPEQIHVSLEKIGVSPKKTDRLLDLRDILFERGEVEAAQLAHLHAMPLVSDIINTLQTDRIIVDVYNRTNPGLVDYLILRLSEHDTRNAYLATHTSWVSTDAYVQSFDMKPIVDNRSPGGRATTASQYLLAMHIGMENFFLNNGILDAMSPLFHNYWRKKINQYGNLKKTLNVDEWHTLVHKTINDNGVAVSRPVAGTEYFDWLIKAAPKFNLNLNFASHHPEDFTQTMLGFNTNLFIFGGLEKELVNVLSKHVALSESEKTAIMNLHGPQVGRGTELMLISKTKQGRICSKLEFEVAGLLLWALNTSANDLPHKARLEKEFPKENWLQALADTYPSGSMGPVRKQIINDLRDRLGDDDELVMAMNDTDNEGWKDVEDQLYEQVVKSLEAKNGKNIGKRVVDSLVKEKCA